MSQKAAVVTMPFLQTCRHVSSSLDLFHAVSPFVMSLRGPVELKCNNVGVTIAAPLCVPGEANESSLDDIHNCSIRL